MLRRGAVPVRRRDVLPVRVHLGRQGFRARARLAPGLSEEAGVDLDDAAGRGGEGRASARSRRRLRSDPPGERPAPGRGDAHPEGHVGVRRLRERPADAPLPMDALDRERRRRRARGAGHDAFPRRRARPRVHGRRRRPALRGAGRGGRGPRAAGDDRRVLAPRGRYLRRRDEAGLMRLLRFRYGDRIATGAIERGSDDVRVLKGTFFEDPLPTGEIVPLDDVHLLAPVLPSKLVCLARNYAEHAAEWGLDVPEEPILFLKPSTAVIGPNDPIQLLPISRRVDYEGELAVVIGRIARDVRAEDASKYILGYSCANDVTLRDLQKKDDQWARAKGFDGSCPLGPWIETDLDPTDVMLRTRMNGEVRQQASTTQMIFGVATIVEYITAFMTLLPGDVILTGTPEGVGPLANGDVVEVEVEGVGVLRNEARS